MTLTVDQDNVLMRIRGEGLMDERGREPDHDERIMYVVHPNCIVDDV